MAEPADEDRDDVLLAARYGDLYDIQEFVSKFGSDRLVDVRDENGNGLLHMACGNGHLGNLPFVALPTTLGPVVHDRSV